MNQTDLEQELEKLHEISFHWAMNCCRWNYHEAEEVMQTSYLKILDGRAVYNGQSSIKTWFLAVIRNTAKEQSRRNLLAVLGIERFANMHLPRRETGTAADPVSSVENSELKSLLKSALGHLPRRQQQVLDLVFYQDLTIQDAAAVLNISVGSARVHYGRGKRRLGKLLLTGGK